MATRDIRFRISATDRTSRVFARVKTGLAGIQKSAVALGRSFLKMAGTLGLLAGTAGLATLGRDVIIF